MWILLTPSHSVAMVGSVVGSQQTDTTNSTDYPNWAQLQGCNEHWWEFWRLHIGGGYFGNPHTRHFKSSQCAVSHDQEPWATATGDSWEVWDEAPWESLGKVSTEIKRWPRNRDAMKQASDTGDASADGILLEAHLGPSNHCLNAGIWWGRAGQTQQTEWKQWQILFDYRPKDWGGSQSWHGALTPQAFTSADREGKASLCCPSPRGSQGVQYLESGDLQPL